MIDNKKGMTLQVVVAMAIVLFMVVVIVIIAKDKIDQTKNLGTDCENHNAQCVSVNECEQCSGYADCKLKYPYSCGKDESSGEKLVCCPN